jgi:hypothetical protein
MYNFCNILTHVLVTDDEKNVHSNLFKHSTRYVITLLIIIHISVHEHLKSMWQQDTFRLFQVENNRVHSVCTSYVHKYNLATLYFRS